MAQLDIPFHFFTSTSPLHISINFQSTINFIRLHGYS